MARNLWVAVQALHQFNFLSPFIKFHKYSWGATVIDFEIFIPWQLSDFRILLSLEILQLRCPIPPETKFEFMKILNWLKRKGGW